MMGVLCHNSVWVLCFADSQKVVLPLLPPAFASLPLELLKKKKKKLTAYKLDNKQIQNNVKKACVLTGKTDLLVG